MARWPGALLRAGGTGVFVTHLRAESITHRGAAIRRGGSVCHIRRTSLSQVASSDHFVLWSFIGGSASEGLVQHAHGRG
jgi:hypothetical protein